ncbi:MAG: hypothetical protein ABUL66_01915, partial [Verrucomicrobiota bacterium]
MKTALKISLALNLSFLAVAAFVWTNRLGDGTAMVVSAIPKVKPPVKIATISTPPVTQEAKAQTFHWSQLELSDYPTYVKNLRAIGCPEPTLRVIVTADVDAWHQARSLELEHKLDDFDKLSWSEKLSLNASRQSWLAELQKLPEQKENEIAGLLGTQPVMAGKVAADVIAPSPPPAGSAQSTAPVLSSPANADFLPEVAATVSSDISRSRHSSQPVPVYPLVFREADPALVNLSDQQMQSIQDLRQTFLDEIGGPDQDPND